MKKSLIYALFLFSFIHLNALFYDIFNNSNKELKVIMYPTKGNKPLGQFTLGPNQKMYNAYYNTSTGGGTINVTSWGVKKIRVLDPKSQKYHAADLSKKSQREDLIINLYAYDSDEEAKAAGSPKTVWFNLRKK